MVRKDERGVVIPAPLQGNDAALSSKRYGDKYRGPAVLDAYELSRCRIDLAERSLAWPAPENLPPQMKALAQGVPEEQRAEWLRQLANLDEVDGLISQAIRTGEIPIWVAPIGEVERRVAPDALATIDKRSIAGGVFCPRSEEYKSDDQKPWLWERPLFVKYDDWVRFADKADAVKKRRVRETAQSSDLDEPGRQWLRVSKSIRILHRILKTRLAGQEPAPWIEVPADPLDAEYENATHRHRSTARTSLTMRRALLAGDLTAHLVKNSRSDPLPGWAWENASAAENAFNFNRLPLNPLLEHGLWEFGDRRCFVSRAEFKAWLARSEISEIGDLPNLPAPYDHEAGPDQLSYREPPDRPFVELTQTLTWIAFSISLSRDEFGFMEPCGFGPFAEDGWRDNFSAAITKFSDQASAGNIRVRGRYVANYSDDSAAAQADTAYLTDTQLRDFARFDSLYGGLERGAGLLWGNGLLEHALNGKHDGWRDVEVCRADAMKVFSRQDDIVRALTLPIPATLPDIGSVMGLDEALSWLAHNRPSHDYQVWADRGGEIQIRDPRGEVVQPAEDGSPPQSIEALRQACRHVHAALRYGYLASYVAPRDSSALQVPRAYWNGVIPESLHHVYRGMVPEDKGAGCPILLSRKAFDNWRTQKNSAAAKPERGKVPANRQLDHEKIRDRVREMRRERPNLSKGSAAASIVAELPNNPKTGKPRDQRGIERIIAPLWEGKAE
jgi:hypothetical protein